MGEKLGGVEGGEYNQKILYEKNPFSVKEKRYPFLNCQVSHLPRHCDKEEYLKARIKKGTV